ncbi:MAG: hypothetical protein ACJAUG_003650 [Halioglobus sp.]|jgi:hypothetical protein
MRSLLLPLGLFLPAFADAADGAISTLNLTTHWVGYAALAIFSLAYLLVIFEEKIHLRKSNPVLLAAGLIWILTAIAYNTQCMTHTVEQAIRHNFLEYTELFFFLLVAMTYINAMIGRVDVLKQWFIAAQNDRLASRLKALPAFDRRYKIFIVQQRIWKLNAFEVRSTLFLRHRPSEHIC